MKTLALILNYNYPEITDALYESLLPYVDDTHDLGVIDNGSPTPEGMSQYTTLVTGENGYFGGGLNFALDLLKLPIYNQYDSIAFLTNDITVTTFPLIQPMRAAMLEGYHWVGASVTEEPNGTFWRQTRPHGATEPRPCKWFDLQCTLLHRELCEAIGHYDDVMKYGWGQDIWTGIVVEQNNWKAAMLDIVNVIHAGDNNTFRTGRNSMAVSTYSDKCAAGMYSFYGQTAERQEKFFAMRAWADGYRYP